MVRELHGDWAQVVALGQPHVGSTRAATRAGCRPTSSPRWTASTRPGSGSRPGTGTGRGGRGPHRRVARGRGHRDRAARRPGRRAGRARRHVRHPADGAGCAARRLAAGGGARPVRAGLGDRGRRGRGAARPRRPTTPRCSSGPTGCATCRTSGAACPRTGWTAPGFVHLVWRRFGVILPRDARDQAAAIDADPGRARSAPATCTSSPGPAAGSTTSASWRPPPENGAGRSCTPATDAGPGRAGADPGRPPGRHPRSAPAASPAEVQRRRSPGSVRPRPDPLVAGRSRRGPPRRRSRRELSRLTTVVTASVATMNASETQIGITGIHVDGSPPLMNGRLLSCSASRTSFTPMKPSTMARPMDRYLSRSSRPPSRK